MSWKRIDVPFIRHFVLKMRRKIEVVVWDDIRQIDVVWLVVGGEAGTRKKEKGVTITRVSSLGRLDIVE